MQLKPRLSLPRLLALLVCFLPGAALCEEKAPANERHIVVVVWDGMRPDFVTERNAPTLWRLAREGVTFRHHHSVYPTMTYVNGAAIATGVYPNRSGLLGNREYRPRIDSQKEFESAAPEIIKKGDETSGGKYLAVPTTAEVIRAAGRRTAIAGTKSVVYLHDRHAEWTSTGKNSSVKFAAAPMTQSVREETLRLLGPFLKEPAKTSEDHNADATRILTDILWRDDLPAYSLLWLSEPDLTQHEYSPGAELSMAAIRSSDRNLAAVLDTLSKKKARETTDVLVVSDHGFSTIERGIDFPGQLRAAGFDAVAAFEQAPKAGQIMVVGNAGTIFFYIVEHDRTVASRLVEWLQRSEFAGVIFSHEEFEGAFPLELAHVNTAEAPDVMVALRWNPKPNRFGIPGQILTDASRGAGHGSHATLSEFDVHNTLIAAGPGFRRGMLNDLPSCNIDLAPTVLHLLGLEAPHKFEGRVLSEAMISGSAPPRAVSSTLEVTRKFPSGQWRQHLRVSRVGETTYIDEGNGAFEASSPPSPSP
jgi:arylsulfatase A-like enzyme